MAGQHREVTLPELVELFSVGDKVVGIQRVLREDGILHPDIVQRPDHLFVEMLVGGGSRIFLTTAQQAAHETDGHNSRCSHDPLHFAEPRFDHTPGGTH